MNTLELKLQYANSKTLEPINVKNLAFMKGFFVKHLQNKHEFQITTRNKNHAHTLTLRSKLSDQVYPVFFFDNNPKDELRYFREVWDKYVEERLVEPLCIFSSLKKFAPDGNIIRRSKGEISYLFEYLDKANTQHYVVEDRKKKEFKCFRAQREQYRKRSSTQQWRSDGIILTERDLLNGLRTLRVVPDSHNRYQNLSGEMYQESFEF